MGTFHKSKEFDCWWLVNLPTNKFKSTELMKLGHRSPVPSHNHALAILPRPLLLPSISPLRTPRTIDNSLLSSTSSICCRSLILNSSCLLLSSSCLLCSICTPSYRPPRWPRTPNFNMMHLSCSRYRLARMRRHIVYMLDPTTTTIGSRMVDVHCLKPPSGWGFQALSEVDSVDDVEEGDCGDTNDNDIGNDGIYG